MPRLLQKRMPHAACAPAPQRRSDPHARKTASEALHHQKPSRIFETKVRANSRESRCSAGESSSKKLLSSRETWYRSRIFFQAEDGIRYYKVTGVQTCALPI